MDTPTEKYLDLEGTQALIIKIGQMYKVLNNKLLDLQDQIQTLYNSIQSIDLTDIPHN